MTAGPSIAVVTTLALSLSLVAATGGAAAQPAAPELAGHWERTDHEADDARRRAEIERVTADMGFLVRAIARAVMARAMVPPERYAIGTAQPGLTFQADDDEPERAMLTGKEEGHGDHFATSRAVPGGFERHWRHGDKSRGKTVWRLSEDGTHLTIAASLSDPRFDGELTFATRYRRVPR